MELHQTHMSEFKLFTKYNLFLFTKDEAGKTHFLLLRDGNKYSQVNGSVNQDPCVIFSIANKFVKQTAGLLCSRNWIYYLEDSAHPIQKSTLAYQVNMEDIHVDKSLTVPLEDICKLLCNTPYIFQDQSDCATYFLKIPYLNIPKVLLAAKEIDFPLDLKYFSIEEIMENSNTDIDERLMSLLYSNKNLFAYLNNFIANNTPIETKQNIIFLGCNTHITYLLPSLYASYFKKHGEVWTFYHAPSGHLPTEEDIKKATAVIIPGSCASANDSDPWLADVFHLITLIKEKYTHVKLLGICFGSQAITKALGGEVDRMPGGFVEGGETLEFKPEFFKLPFVQKLNFRPSNKFVIAEIHQDHVTKLAPGATHLASSKSCKFEAFSIGNNILGFQGHPDYSETYQASLHYRLYQPQASSYREWEGEFIKTKFEDRLTQKEMLQICFSFLKNREIINDKN